VSHTKEYGSFSYDTKGVMNITALITVIHNPPLNLTSTSLPFSDLYLKWNIHTTSLNFSYSEYQGNSGILLSNLKINIGISVALITLFEK